MSINIWKYQKICLPLHPLINKHIKNMKKLDLNKLFAGLTKKFGVNMYDIGHMLNSNAITPHDVVIDAYGRNVKESDLRKIEKLLKRCITGKVISQSVKIKGNKIHIYVEFKHMIPHKKRSK